MRSQILYFRIRDAADEVKELSHDYYDGCLLDRNRYMVDHAGTLLAGTLRQKAGPEDHHYRPGDRENQPG